MLASSDVRHFPELPSFDPALELVPDLGIGGLPHAAHERRLKNGASVLYGGSLEHTIARPRYGPLSLHLRILQPILPVLARSGDYTVRLMSVLCGQVAVPL
jgi:hypothetical protein